MCCIVQHVCEGYQFWQAVTILVWAVLFKTADEGKACRPRQVHLVSLYSGGGHLSCGAKISRESSGVTEQ